MQKYQNLEKSYQLFFKYLITFGPISETTIPISMTEPPIILIEVINSSPKIAENTDANIGSIEKMSAALTGVVNFWAEV